MSWRLHLVGRLHHCVHQSHREDVLFVRCVRQCEELLRGRRSIGQRQAQPIDEKRRREEGARECISNADAGLDSDRICIAEPRSVRVEMDQVLGRAHVLGCSLGMDASILEILLCVLERELAHGFLAGEDLVMAGAGTIFRYGEMIGQFIR